VLSTSAALSQGRCGSQLALPGMAGIGAETPVLRGPRSGKCCPSLIFFAREYATRAELQSIADQTTDRTAYLRLAETLTAFLARLRLSAETLDIIERQRVVRLLVKEILVSDDRIVIRHSIPLPTGPSGSHDPSPIGGYSSPASGKSYLLRSGSDRASLLG
jgi:site-specific DNA recombinase